MPRKVSQFDDFELLVSDAQRAGGYSLTAMSGQAGQAAGSLVIDPNASDLQAALHKIALRDTTEDLFRQLGRQLFKALFSDPIRDLYRTSLGLAQGSGRGLRLRLMLDPPAISALPWEYLYDPDADLPLAISPDHCLSRYVLINEPIHTLAVKLPLRVLIVVSAPSDLEDYGLRELDADKEISQIQEALREHTASGAALTDVLPHAVAADLREKLRRFQPHVVHLIGHGLFQNDQGKLLMENEEHQVWPVSDRQFREFFLGAENVRLVILNVCQGATQSSAHALAGLAPQVVRRGIGAVLAMQAPIPDKAAICFAREFYRALAVYDPVDAAVAQGRRAVYLDYGPHRPDWGTPVIFMRSTDGLLFNSPDADRAVRQTESSSSEAARSDVRQGGVTHFYGPVMGPVHTGSGDINIVTPSQAGPLDQLFQALQLQIVAQAPADKRDKALEKAGELKEAITSSQPDLDAMAAIKNWFGRNIPQLAGTVTGLILHPMVSQLIEAAGEVIASEFKRRFTNQADERA